MPQTIRMKLRIILVVLVVAACTPDITVKDSLTHYLPKDAAAIIQVNDFSKFKSELKNNSFFTVTQDIRLFGKLKKDLQHIEFEEDQLQFTIGIYELGKGNFEFVVLTKDKLPSIALEGVTDKTIESFSYENKDYNKYTLDGITVFAMAVNDIMITTSSQILLENFIRIKETAKPSNSLKRIQTAADTTLSANVFLNFKHGDVLFKKYLKNQDINSIPEFADWLGVDIAAGQANLSLNGICFANDSTKNFVNLFKGTSPLPNSIVSKAPQGADAILSYAFNDFSTFIKNQTAYLDLAKPKDTLFTTVEEIGIVFLNEEKAVVLNSYGAETLMENLIPYKTSIFEYQGNEIIGLSEPKLLQENLNPLVPSFSNNFYTVIDNSFVFAGTREVLQNFISNTKNQTTFDKTSTYTSAKNVLSSEANMTFIANRKGIQHFLDTDFVSNLSGPIGKLDLNDYSFSGQLVADQGFLHTSMNITKGQEQLPNNAVGALFTVELDTDIATDPQFVKNHRTGQKEVVVQDIDNYVYLISTKGKVLWKKQLEGRIRGKIHQVDLYKNGKLQLAFCTNNQFLILDRNGELVPPFNKTYEGGNLNALAVFDYEKNKNYRFVITQGRKVFMYDGQGATVDGFVYKEAQHPIKTAPEHFRIAKKDYLVFKLDDNTMTIRHRAGQERIKVPTKINFSDNGVFLYKNKFTVTDKKGVLHQIDTKGKLSKTNFNLGTDHGMYATSKTLALMNENVLNIKGKKVELELGVYTAPKIFYIYDKIYVSVTDIQNQQIYLFDSQAKPIANFPVYGTSAIDLDDMDQDKTLELVAKDQENSLIVYKIN